MEEASETLHYYAITPGQVDASGIEYEINMATLLYLRATKNNYQFLLATNVKAAGKFDDVVLEYDDGTKIKTVLIQLKHKQRKPVKYTDLLSTEKRHGDFSLIKYYKSYCEIRNSFMNKTGIKWRGKFEDFKFVLCTNAQMNSKRITCTQNQQPEIDLVMAGGKIVSLTHSDILKKELNEKFSETEDLKYMNEFLSQAVLIIEQANKENLDIILKEEIQEIYKLSENGAVRALKYLNEQIHLWWKNKNASKAAIKENAFSVQTANEILTELNKDKKNLEHIEINFRDEIIFQSQDLLGGFEKIINVRAEKISTQLACLKLLHVLNIISEMPLYVTTETLLVSECVKNILNIWPSHWCKYIMIGKHQSTDDSSLKYILKNLTQQVRHTKESKIIIVSTAPCVELFQTEELGGIIKTTEITTELREITDSSKNILLHKKLNFQGHSVTLNDIFGSEYYDICSELISDLISDETLKLGKQITPAAEYFINRCFTQKCYVKSSILFSGPTEIITFCELDESRLQAFLKEKGTEISSPVTKELTENRTFYQKLKHKMKSLLHKDSSNAKYCSPVHIVKTLDDYNILCKEKVNVHWLELKDEHLRWKQTYGDMSAVQNNIEDEHEKYEVTSVWDIPDRIVLITADCGMGKSTLIQGVAHYTKTHSPAKFIIKINLNDCTPFFASLEGKEITFNDLKKFLLLGEDIKNKRNYQIKIFSNLISYPEKCVVLIDGFDEMVPYYENVVTSLLLLIRKTEFAKFWLTSRTTYTHKLEQLFRVLTFTVNPLNEFEQNKFFTEYWKSKEISDDPVIVNTFATKIMEVNDGRNFFGMPLYCKMAAEVYKDLVHNNLVTSEFPKLTLFNLCDKFVEQSFNIYCSKYGMSNTNTEIREMIKQRKKKFYDNHMIAAMSVFFNTDELNKINNIKKLSENLLGIELEEKAGLINFVINGRPQFIHNVFVEYFVAKFASENITLNQDLIKYLYRNKRFNVVANFIDQIVLATEPLHAAVIASDLLSVKQILQAQEQNVDKTDVLRRTPLHLALSYGYSFNIGLECQVDIVEELLRYGAKVNIEDNIAGLSPFNYASVSIFRWQILAAMYEYSDITATNIEILKNLIKGETNYRQVYHILNKGYFNFVNFFLKYTIDMEGLKSDLLDEASAEGNLDALIFILDQKVFKYYDYNASKLIHTAIRKGHLHIVEYINSEYHLQQHALVRKQLAHKKNLQNMRLVQYMSAQQANSSLSVMNSNMGFSPF